MKVDLKSLVLAGVPQTDVTLTDGRVVRVRAFLVKELKLLMLAKEGGSEDTTIIQVMQQCIQTEGIDVEMLPSFDVEMLYLQLFALSKGSSLIDVAFVCQNHVDNKICGTKIKTRVNLKTVTFNKDLKKDNLIKVNDQMTIEMRFPSILEQQYFGAIRTAGEGVAKLIDMCLNCVSKIYVNEQELIVGVDTSKEDLAEMMELVSGDIFEKMTTFIEDCPMIHTHVALKCPKCGAEDSVELVGLADFFV
ncbi:MAG: hypothetical protein [Caudoviricetes sp.]|nr:MAG: hypothetical protein [Caudoviricetes sp.]